MIIIDLQQSKGSGQKLDQKELPDVEQAVRLADMVDISKDGDDSQELMPHGELVFKIDPEEDFNEDDPMESELQSTADAGDMMAASAEQGSEDTIEISLIEEADDELNGDLTLDSVVTDSGRRQTLNKGRAVSDNVLEVLANSDEETPTELSDVGIDFDIQPEKIEMVSDEDDDENEYFIYDKRSRHIVSQDVQGEEIVKDISSQSSPDKEGPLLFKMIEMKFTDDGDEQCQVVDSVGKTDAVFVPDDVDLSSDARNSRRSSTVEGNW